MAPRRLERRTRRVLAGLGLVGVGGIIAWGVASASARARVEAARRAAEAEAAAEVQWLLDAAYQHLDFAARVLDVAMPPLVIDPSVSNALSDGSFVRVNLAWLRAVLGRQCSTALCLHGVVLGVMGHELSHHRHGDAFRPASRRERKSRELRADSEAAIVLREAGLPPDDYARTIATEAAEGGPNHPRGDLRAQTIWNTFYAYA